MGTPVKVMVNTLSPGVRLAEDVYDAKGRKLIPAGTELTQALIDRLEARDIHHVFINEIDTYSPEQRAAFVQEIENSLNNRFRKAGNHDLMQQLKQIIQAFHVSRL